MGASDRESAICMQRSWLMLRGTRSVSENRFMTKRSETVAEREWHELKAELGERPGETLNLLDVERLIQEHLGAMGRELMVATMKKADTDCPEVEIDGATWGARSVTPGEYFTLFGWVTIERSVYQQSGRGRVAVPMDLRLGIVERAYTPRVARIVTRATAVMTDEEAAELLVEIGTASVSKSSISRVSRAMAARYEQRRPVIEASLRSQESIPSGAVTVQVALDGVMVPQDGEHAKPRGRKSEEPDPPRHELRYGAPLVEPPASSDGTLGRSWHEASVGTVAFFDGDGSRLHTIYHGRMPEAFKATLVKHLTDELMSVLAERPDMNVVFASDGAAPQWSSLRAMANALPANFTGHTMDLVDAFHVAEYLQNAADAIDGKDTKEARIQSATWRETVKEAGGPITVLRSMRAQRTSVPTDAREKELDAAIGYVDRQNKAGRMDYAEAIERNYPIGTGITEAAAKTVVGTRMKRAGARFSQHGGQTVMLFRTTLLSNRFEALHRELGKSYAKHVREAA